MRLRLAVGSLVVASLVAMLGCSETTEEDASEAGDSALAAGVDDHWFYTGVLPPLTGARATVSIAGNTVRIQGELPDGVDIPALPHVLRKGKRVDVVYPIATARPEKFNSRPGSYAFRSAMPYKPDALAVTASEPDPHWVTWGGFPFVAYNGGIAFHGPITSRDNIGKPDMEVWYLRRGRVSGGCNRMMGEHVVELSHLVGVNMRKVYAERQTLPVPNAPAVDVIGGYDVLDYGDGSPAKYVDVDYPTDDAPKAQMTRPQKVHGRENVVMFGSWVATETPDGRDLPPTMSSVDGPYVFKDHAIPGAVCSYPKDVLKTLGRIAASNGGQLPKNVCDQRARRCAIDLMRFNGAANASQVAQGAVDAGPCFNLR